MADQYLFAKPQKRKEEDEIVNPFAGNNMPELGKQNIINPFDSPDSIEEQAPPVNIFESAEKSAEPSLDERTDSEFYEWFNYNMANPDFAPTDSQYDRFNKIRINKGIKLGKVFDAATEVPAMLWDEMVKRPGKSQVVEMARRYQKSYSNKLRGSASANEKAMKDFGLNYDDSQRIKNPLDRRRPINLGLSMGPIRPSNDSIQKVRDQLKEAWINHNYKIFNTATEGAELIASIQGLSKDEKAEQEKTIEFLMREKVNSVNSIYRQNLKNILPERLHKKIDSMSDKQLKGLFDGSKVEPPNRALFFGKEFLTYGLRGIPSSAEGVARATADLGVLGTQLRHYLNDKISPDDVEGQRERLKLHRQILMDRMAKHQGESTYIGDTLRAARMDSVADWFDRSIDPATAEMMSYMVGPEAAAGSLVKAPVKTGAKSATAPTRSQMLRDAYTKNIQAPLVKAEKAVGDAITEVLPSAAMKAAGATGGVLGEGAIKVGELPEKIAGKMAFMLTRNADTAAKVERALGKGTYGVGALDIAGGFNMPIPLVGSISVVAGKLKLMGQLGKSLGEGAKAAGRAWNQKSQKQFLARVAFDPKASPALRNFANWASTIDPALGWAANIGNGMGRGALTGGILTLPTKDEAAIGGGLGIGVMLGGGGSFVGLPYASKLRNAEGQAADIKWFGEETEKHGYMTREQYDLLPDKLKLYAADAQMILGDHPEHGFKIILTPDGKSFRKAFEENGGVGMASDSGVVIPNKRGDGGVAIVNASKKGAITTLLHEIGGHSVTRGQDMGDLMTALLDNYGADGISKMKDEYALNLLAGEKVINNPNISLDDALMSVAKTPSEVDAYIREKDLSNPSWWAEEVFASHFAKKALEEGGLLGMSKETRMTIATRKALVEKGGAMLQRIGINIRPDGSIPDPTGLFEVSQIKDSPELDLFVRNYLVERANLLHEIRISNKPKARKGAKIAPERLKDHPAIKWDWNEKSGLWETDFATKTDDGVVTLKSNSEVKQTLADRLEASNKLISDQVVERSNPYLAPKDDGSGGIEIRGTKLPPEFYDLPQFTKSTKDHARAVEEAIDGDTTFQGWYNAIGTSRNPDGWARSVQKGLGNMRTRFREWKPLGFQTTKAGHILETVLDVDATLAKASQFQSEGRLDQYFNGSLEVFHRDLTNYLENHKSGEPGEKGIGPDKRNFIRAFLGVPGGQNPLGMTMPTGESLIKTFRLDRMGEVNPTNRRGFFFDYMKVKQNFMPAGKKKGLPPDVGEVSKGYKGKRTLGKLGRATERNKELQDLAQNVDQMSQAEWNAAVERLDPIIPTPDSKIPNPSMFKAMDRSLKALDKNGKPFVMDVSQYKSIRNPAPGSNVKKVRIDISAMERAMEAYSRGDIETPLHPVAFYDENGIGYASHLYIKDGTFSYPGNIQPRILETSQGRSKDTFIFTEGEVIGGPLPSRAELMRVNNKGERVWTEAGVNPLRHGYAYDKNNPSIKIHGGDRMLLANNSVWVRNARKVEAVKVPGLRRMGSGEFEGPEVRYMPAGKGGDIFYSNTSKALESPKVRNSATGPAMLNDLLKHGGNMQEIKWMDLDNWLMSRKGKVSKEELAQYINENQILVRERLRTEEVGDTLGDLIQEHQALLERYWDIERGDAPDAPQRLRDLEEEMIEMNDRIYEAKQSGDATIYDKEQGGRLNLPGAEPGSYRELTLMFPPSTRGTGMFLGSHFEEPNVFAHVRFNDRIDADGKRMLFLEEVQSDWHSAARRHGFDESNPNRVGKAPLISQIGEDGVTPSNAWRLTAIKRMIRWAADNGYDRMGWITGGDTATRYNLNTYIDKIEYDRISPEFTQITAWDKAGNKITDRKVGNKDLGDVVSDKIARKIIESPDEWGELSGLDLEVGGKGHRDFYDKQLPNTVGRYVKKWGGKVGMVGVSKGYSKTGNTFFTGGAVELPVPPGVKNEFKAHYIDITPQMKADVQQGQAMFMPAGSDAAYMRAAEKGDIKGAQLLVDQAAKAAGYEIDLFHGGPEGIKVFNKSLPWGKAGGEDGVIYAASERSAAEYYADLGEKGKVYDIKVKVRKPFLTDDEDLILDPTASDIRRLKSQGYDSIVSKNKMTSMDRPSSVYVLFDPNQIKSADPITRDDAGNIIPLSERFQSGSDDIRYMPAGGEVTVYRGTTSGRKVSDRHGGFHFAAMDKKQAEAYALGDSNGVRQEKINLDKILSEEEARNVMREIGIAPKDYEFSALVDKQYASSAFLDSFIGKANLEKFRDELIKRGKLGVRFADFDATDAGSKRPTKESLFLLNTRN